LSVILRFTDYDYPFGIFKLFLHQLIAMSPSILQCMVNWNYRIEPAVYVNMTQFYMMLKI